MNVWTRGTGWNALAVLALAAATGVGTAGTPDRGEKGFSKDVSLSPLQIDRGIQLRLAEAKIEPAPLADDAEFLRRVYLDITGVIPPADKAAAFLDSKEPNKRARLIDELLDSPLYGRHMADIWQALLLPRNSDNRRLQAEPMEKWLTENFNSNKPWDKMVSDLLTASGTQDENGATTFFIANQTPDKLNDTVCSLFMAVQLQCAQCHNHPFTSWKRKEYWGMAAFFSKVRAGRAKQVAKGVNAGVTEIANGRPGKVPNSALSVSPKFLGAPEPKIDANEPYRPVLARWLTSADNPYFAKAMVNRTWAHFFGRGFVNPIDNMHDDNPPSHPELFAALAQQFAAGGFDVKQLVRGICNSQSYQRSSKSYANNAEDKTLFSHMAVKVMSPEQLYDSLAEVLGAPANDGRPARKAQQGGRQVAGPRAAFVAFFQGDEGADPTEYQAGVPQALRLMNSPQLNRTNVAWLSEALKSSKSPGQVIEQLYLATLSRRPTSAEVERLTSYVSKDSDSRQAYGDILWAVLNSSEFTSNH